MHYIKFKEDLLAEVKARLPSEQGYEVDYRGESRYASEYLKIRCRGADLTELPVKVFVTAYEEHQDFYGVSQKEILAAGLANTKEQSPLRIYPIPVKGQESMAAVTTFDRFYGATALLYPGVQEELRRQMHGDYYVVPLNVHEILAVRKRSPIKEEQIRVFQKKMWQETPGKDFLSSGLFLYHSREKRLTVCENQADHYRKSPDHVR